MLVIQSKMKFAACRKIYHNNPTVHLFGPFSLTTNRRSKCWLDYWDSAHPEAEEFWITRGFWFLFFNSDDFQASNSSNLNWQIFQSMLWLDSFWWHLCYDCIFLSLTRFYFQYNPKKNVRSVTDHYTFLFYELLMYQIMKKKTELLFLTKLVDCIQFVVMLVYLWM